MADMFTKYGIKEVADVTFYDIDNDYPVLYLDTLKVSTIEQTAEEAEAKGGKGNSPLIIWDYGREITVDIQDALFSMKSMAIMFGDKTITDDSTYSVYRSFAWTATASSAGPGTSVNGITFSAEPTVYQTGTSTTVATASIQKGVTYYIAGKVATTGNVSEIEISPNTFPGTYKVVGDTFARNAENGKDEMFQFIIPKAKVQSEQTITLEAEGDPTVFNLKLRVLRPNDGGAMMKLVKYSTTVAAG